MGDLHREDRSRRALLIATVLSAFVHVVVVALPMQDNRSSPQDRFEPQVIEVVERAPARAPDVLADARADSNGGEPREEAPSAGGEHRRPRRVNRHENEAKRLLLARAAPTATHRLVQETPAESSSTTEPREEQQTEEPTHLEGVELPSAEDVARRGVVAPLEGLDDEGQMLRRVQRRTDGLLRDALPPRLNDPPAYPELLLDDDGNFTWHFYYLVAKIRPDGSVLFDHGVPVGGKTGRYCRALSTGPGQCEELPSVPFPPGENPMGSFPENPIKRWFLERTKALRDQMADLDRRQTLATATTAAIRNVRATWTNPSLDVASRRRLLFELWDECEEPRGRDDERPEARVGQQARDRILQFIRQEAPAGSPDAYTDAELRALNARRTSRQRFDPYRELR